MAFDLFFKYSGTAAVKINYKIESSLRSKWYQKFQNLIIKWQKMFMIKSKKVTLLLCFCALPVFVLPGLAQAESYESGEISSSRAAEQRAANAKRKERIRKEKEAEAAKKSAEAQSQKPAETQAPVAEPKIELVPK